MILFAEQKFEVVSRVYFCFVAFAFAVKSPPQILPKLVLRSPMFSSQNFMVLSLMIKSYFELVFVYGARWWSSFINFACNFSQ